MQNLPIAVRAQQALAGVTTEAALIALADKAKEITAITNPDGYKQCHATRMELRGARITIEKAGKGARDDANAFAKAIIAEEKRLLGFIAPEETRLDGIQKQWDADREAEKRAKEEAERQRVQGLRAEVDRIKNRPVIAAAWPSAKLREELAGLQAFVLTAEDFQEFLPEAQQALAASIEAVTGLIDAAEQREAEAARIEAERAELERLRAEQAERDRIAAEEKAEADRIAREELEQQQAEIRRQQAELLQQQEEQKRQAREARKAEESKLRAERERQEAELRAQREAEEKRLAEERAAHEAQMKAEREEQERLAAEIARQEAEARQRQEREGQERKEAEEAARREQEAKERAKREAAEAARNRLEKAAPKLLAALQRLVEAHANDYGEDCPATIMARAAIAEATGETP